MPFETRVNLLHLLEDIRDSYALPIEEVIITELVANALDSGASRIEFAAEPERQSFLCLDDGRGMTRRELKAYHDIAATTKERGRGIGFAGIGAKLSLLVASAVRTETRGPRGSHSATEWRLTSPVRAPWRFVPSQGRVSGSRGTVVTIETANRISQLLDPLFIRKTIRAHFSPFFNPFLIEKALRPLYRREIGFFINGERITFSPENEERHFEVFLTRGSRRPVGVGYIAKRALNSAPNHNLKGLAVSAYGKVIKCGWEWIGVYPKSYDELYGAVEVPGLVALLTTNKTDFLHDGASIKKYYRYRKAVQAAVREALREFGEERAAVPQAFSERFIPLKHSIESTLETLVADFPELNAIVGERRVKGVGASAPFDSPKPHTIGIPDAAGFALALKIPQSNQEGMGDARIARRARSETPRASAPGLKIAFEAFAENESASALGRLNEDAIIINTNHTAWRKAEQEGFSDYHVVTTVAWALSQFLQEGRLPHEFVGKFLAAWGDSKRQRQTLFEA
jgi:hypothetical protein